ncbi:MAG: YCF48-related protein [Candidatus Edwardsbacteria bacterium]
MKRIKIAILSLAGMALFAAQSFTATYTVTRWEPQVSGTTQNLRGVCAVSETDAWAVGENGTVLHTTNGGQTWTSVSTPVGTAYHFNDVCFVSSTTGWVVGEKNATPDQYQGILLRTQNGGSTWLPPQYAGVDILPGKIPPYTPFLSVKMVLSAGKYRGYIGAGNGNVLRYLPPPDDKWERCKSPSSKSDSISEWYNYLWEDPTNANQAWVTGDQGAVSAKTAE